VADGLDNPIDTPSLRGAAYSAPYGRDGRFASLREFTRNVVVNEFSGREPSRRMLDGLVRYIRQLEFLPNAKLTADGQLTDKASAAAKAGERLFRKPYAAMNGRSCASCHTPAAQFSDGQQYNVGTGAVYETPTLRNANYTAPYFAEGSAADYGEAVTHFDDFYSLELTAQEQNQLVAYLNAVGAGENPTKTKDFAFDMSEILTFVGTLDRSLEDKRPDVVQMTVDTINTELRDVREHWKRPADRKVRSVIAGWVVQMRRVATLARDGQWESARETVRSWQKRVARERSQVAAAEDSSLYKPEIRKRYRRELRNLTSAASSTSQ